MINFRPNSISVYADHDLRLRLDAVEAIIAVVVELNDAVLDV
ncbi:MAG: hypothetical protein AB8B95_03710 [Pseudohongiellaceae bacterium]